MQAREGVVELGWSGQDADDDVSFEVDVWAVDRAGIAQGSPLYSGPIRRLWPRCAQQNGNVSGAQSLLANTRLPFPLEDSCGSSM